MVLPLTACSGVRFLVEGQSGREHPEIFHTLDLAEHLLRFQEPDGRPAQRNFCITVMADTVGHTPHSPVGVLDDVGHAQTEVDPGFLTVNRRAYVDNGTELGSPRRAAAIRNRRHPGFSGQVPGVVSPGYRTRSNSSVPPTHRGSS